MAKSKSKSKAQSALNGSHEDPNQGPATAKDIPWLKLIEDHVLHMEDHYQMLEILTIHASEGTEARKTLKACLERARIAKNDSRAVLDGTSPSKGPGFGEGHVLLESNGLHFGSASASQADTSSTSVTASAQASEPVFIIDTNPKPVDMQGISNKHNKREGAVDTDITRRPKRTKVENPVETDAEADVEREDITDIVEARLKAKAEKRDGLEIRDKKRKRKIESSSAEESSGEYTDSDSDSDNGDNVGAETQSENGRKTPKKKKRKGSEVVRSNPVKRKREEKEKRKAAKKAEKMPLKETDALNRPKKNKKKYKRKKVQPAA